MAKSLLFYLLLSQGLLTSAYALPLEDCESPGSEGYTSATEKIEVDVAIIGGGSCGINAATWLLDRNRTVVVLEAKNQTGGHAETYQTPTGVPVNLGVAIFTNTTTITNYLSRYNVPLTRFNLTTINAVASTSVDFSTGNIIANATTPSAQQQASALLQYAAQLAKYPEITFGYNLPSPVPEDLLLPFGQFVDKYNLGAMMDSVFRFNQGYVPLLEIPTLYMLKYFGPFQLQSFQQGYFMVSATGDTRTLYDNAAKELGSRVLYSVSDMKVQRPSNGDRVSIMVGNSSTGPRIVYAKKLITAIPPTLQSLQSAGFDLDSSEKSIFGKFFSNAYYSLIIRNSGIQTTLFNRNTANKYGIPNFPAIYTIIPVQGDSELMQIYYASAEPLSEDEVKANVLADINRLPASLRGHSTPEIVSMASHSPFNVMVSPEDIKNGYYSTLERLQGMKNTWYYGAAIATHSSSTIWEGLEKDFLPRFLATF